MWGLWVLTKYRTARNSTDRDGAFIGQRLGDKITILALIFAFYLTLTAHAALLLCTNRNLFTVGREAMRAHAAACAATLQVLFVRESLVMVKDHLARKMVIIPFSDFESSVANINLTLHNSMQGIDNDLSPSNYINIAAVLFISAFVAAAYRHSC